MSEIVTKDHSFQEPTVSHQHPLETIPQGTQDDGVQNGHDHSDANVDVLLKVTAGLMALIFGSLVLCWFVMDGIMKSLEAKDTVPSATYVERPNLKKAWPSPAVHAELQPREENPDLQPDPEKPLLVLREEEYQQLENYNWVKDEKGQRVAVSIPIEEAMKLTAQRGLPTEATAKVKVRQPTGHVAEMGSIPPSETQMEKEILKSKGLSGDKKTREPRADDRVGIIEY